MSLLSKILIILATISWLGFVIFLSVLPRLPRPAVIPTNWVDWVGHFGSYFLLSALIYIAFSSEKDVSSAKRLRNLTGGVVIASLLGVSIEGVQHFVPERVVELSDISANFSGAVLGASLIFVLHGMKLGARFLKLSASILVLAFIFVSSVALILWDPGLPRVGDHWHARYVIAICGQTQAPLPGTQGAIHTHGEGAIHVHPFHVSQAGHNASMSSFMTTSRAKLTSSELVMPDGTIYRDGKNCPDGGIAKLRVFANGVLLADPASYVPKNRDFIAITYGTEADVDVDELQLGISSPI